MFLDLIYNFLLAYRVEGESKLITNFDMIFKRYWHSGKFLKDFILWQPLFYFLSLEYEPFVIMLLIKEVRF